MSVTDPIADFLTRIRNAVSMKHASVSIPGSKIKIEIARILKDEGFIQDYSVERGPTRQSMIRIRLYYHANGQPAITGLKRISKPGLKVYVGKDEIPRYYGGLATSVLSTSKGIMTNKEARRQGVGGELLCYVW